MYLISIRAWCSMHIIANLLNIYPKISALLISFCSTSDLIAGLATGATTDAIIL